MTATENFRESIATLVEEAYPQLADHVEEGVYHGSPALIMDGAVLTLLDFNTIRLEDYHGNLNYIQIDTGVERDLARQFVAASSPYGEYYAALAQGPEGWELEPWGSGMIHSAWRSSDGTYVEVDMSAMFSPDVIIDYYGISLTLRGVTANEARIAVETLEEHGVAAMVDQWLGRSESLREALSTLPNGATEDAKAEIASHPTPGGYGHYWVVTIDGAEHMCNTGGRVVEVIADALAG
nr:MAG TPA: hypothetical protein [Caudoviricetes sp.]